MADVAPTKTNLLRLRREIAFASEGHELLGQKKDILTAELLALVDRTRTVEQQMDDLLRTAFSALQRSVVRLGRSAVQQTAAAATTRHTLSISTRRVMGVSLPTLEITIPPITPTHSLAETTVWTDETASAFLAALRTLALLVETKVSLKRLALEVKRSIRRVNALEKIAIPSLRENLKYVTESLDEMEREVFFTMKLVKNRLMERRTASEKR